MKQCVSVRKKGSTDQCLSNALIGHTFCGRHARMKVPVLWTTANTPKVDKATQIQAIVRGWLVRKRLKLAGPGILCRKLPVNDEDFVSCDSKLSKHPYDYFAFEEDGKIWWFDFASLWKWSIQSHTPFNPYTRKPLDTETRKRLREIWSYKQRSSSDEDWVEESRYFSERVQQRWNLICQIFHDNGFVDIHPSMFLRFTKSDYNSLFVLLKRDLEIVVGPNVPQRQQLFRLCNRLIRSGSDYAIHMYILQSTYTLLLLLTAFKDPYVMVFSVLSALYRC